MVSARLLVSRAGSLIRRPHIANCFSPFVSMRYETKRLGLAGPIAAGDGGRHPQHSADVEKRPELWGLCGKGGGPAACREAAGAGAAVAATRAGSAVNLDRHLESRQILRIGLISPTRGTCLRHPYCIPAGVLRLLMSVAIKRRWPCAQLPGVGTPDPSRSQRPDRRRPPRPLGNGSGAHGRSHDGQWGRPFVSTNRSGLAPVFPWREVRAGPLVPRPENRPTRNRGAQE
jgi:hypothetical protein